MSMQQLSDWTVAEKQMAVDQICNGYPRFFNKFLRYVRNLPPTTRPIYAYLHHILDEALASECSSRKFEKHLPLVLVEHGTQLMGPISSGTTSDLWKSEDSQCISSVEAYRRSGIVNKWL